MFLLRQFQKDALAILNHGVDESRHLLCIAPTGSGKSLIYEKAAAHPLRRTLLVSPLVALARQQYMRLQEEGIQATLGVRGAFQGPPTDESGIWIVSPESLTDLSREKMLRRWRPNFLVVDECHCLWEWGDGFRPAFLTLPDLLETYHIPQSLWLTATLPFEARQQLKARLPSPLTEIGEFELAPSLYLQAQRVPLQDRAQYLFHWLKSRPGPGIIFVPTREATLRVARLIQALGRRAVIYHGGMSLEERKNVEQLIALQSSDIVVATSAFGMGMNYKHLTFVVLWQAPTSLLSLVQTLGRVGRSPHAVNHGLVLWEPEDLRLLEWTVLHSKRRQNELNRVYDFLSYSFCRREFLRAYFENTPFQSGSCRLCDNCENKQAACK